MKTFRLMTVMVLVVGLIVVFSAFCAETTKAKKGDPVAEKKESQGQQKAPAPVSTTIKAPAAAVKSLPLAIKRLYLKDDKVHVVIKKTESKRLSDEAYSTTKLKIETRTLKQPLEWTLLQVDPTKRLTRIRGEKDFDTGIEVKDRIQVTATLYKGSWQTAAVEERKRLTRKLGEDHPRVRRLEPRIERNAESARGFEVQLEAAKINVPDVSEKEALIHGRVVDGNKRGIAGLTVTGENENGQQLRFFGQAETDASGYYSFVIGAEKLKKLARFEEMYLTLRTPTGHLVYRKPDAIKVTAGDRVVVNVNLRRADLYPKVAEN